MNSKIGAIVHQSEGRYLHPDEMQFLQEYVDALPHRIAIYRSLQAKENALLDRVITKFQPMVPNLTRQHGSLAWERCRRDLAQVWRYASLAMLLQDEDFLRDKLLYWLETILKSLKMRDECKPAYKLLLESLQFVLTEAESKLIRPYLLLAQSMLVS
jgi:hypothetical protein